MGPHCSGGETRGTELQWCSSVPIVEPPASSFAWSGLPPDHPGSGLASSTPLVIGLPGILGQCAEVRVISLWA